MVVILLSLLWNHDKLILKFHQEKNAIFMKDSCLFAKVYQKLEIKQRFPYLYINLHDELKSYFFLKKFEIFYSCILKKEVSKS